MNKLTIISDIFYVLAVIFFLTYLFTKRSGFMALGGISMLIGSTIMLLNTKKSKNAKNQDK